MIVLGRRDRYRLATWIDAGGDASLVDTGKSFGKGVTNGGATVEKCAVARLDLSKHTARNDIPRREYRRRLEVRRMEERGWARRDLAMSNARLGIFALTLVLLWLVLVSKILSMWLLAIPVAVFTALVFIHENVVRSRRRVCRRRAQVIPLGAGQDPFTFRQLNIYPVA